MLGLFGIGSQMINIANTFKTFASCIKYLPLYKLIEDEKKSHRYRG